MVSSDLCNTAATVCNTVTVLIDNVIVVFESWNGSTDSFITFPIDRTPSLTSCFQTGCKSLLLPDLVEGKSSRFQEEGLEGKERANREFRGSERADGWMVEGWLELSVSSHSLSLLIHPGRADSLPSRTACKSRPFIFLTCADTGSTARSGQACGAGEGQMRNS